MDNISGFLAEAHRYSQTARNLLSDGQLKDAYVAVAQAVHLYHEVNILVLTLEDGEHDAFQHAVRECIFANTVLRDDIKCMVSPVTTNLDTTTEAPKMEDEMTCSTTGKTDFEKYFASKLETWEEGPGFKSIIGLDYLKEILNGCKLLLPGSGFADRLRLEGAGEFNQHVLLYGPPGTGKTLIVAAYHQEARPIQLIRVSPSDILNCYMGEAEKSLDSLFKVASRNSPVIIFFDEIDGLFGCSKRDGSNVSLINQFLLLLGSAKHVQVIGATNNPWDLQEAIRRRFDHIIYVPLPTLSERKLLFEQYLGDNRKHFSSEELDYAATQTAGYSSSDVRRTTKICLQIPTSKVLKAEAFREIKQKDGTKTFVPCSKSEDGAKEMKLEDVFSSIKFPELTFEDLKQAIRSSKASSDGSFREGSLQSKMAEFTNQFGTDGRNGGNIPEEALSTEVSTPGNEPATYVKEEMKAMTLRGTNGDTCEHHDVDPTTKKRLTSVVECTGKFCVHKPYMVMNFEFQQLKHKEEKGITHALFLLRLRYLQEAHENVKQRRGTSTKHLPEEVGIQSITSLLLQLRLMQDIWAEEKINRFLTWAQWEKRKQLEDIWDQIMKDVINVKVDVAVLKSGDGPSTGQNNLVNGERSRLQHLKHALGMPFRAMERGVKRAYLHFCCPNFRLVEVVKDEGSRSTSTLPCKWNDIEFFRWAEYGVTEVYVGVCEFLHVHYTLKQAGEHAAN